MRRFLFSIALFSIAAVSLHAKEAAAPAIRKEMTFRQMMSAAFNPEKAEKIRTAKLVYAATSTEYPDAVLMFRARKPGFIRIDIVTAADHYVICQDRAQYWGYDGKNGAAPLTREEILELKTDFSFLPIPFYVSSSFRSLTYKGPAMYRTAKCLRYGVDTDSALKMDVWLEEKNGLLCKVNASDKDGKYATAYRDYRDFDGIKIATAILLSNPMGSMTMRLRSVDWNVALPDKLFTKGAVISESATELFRKELIANDANAKALKAAAKKLKEADKARKAEVKKQQETAARKAAADRARSEAEARERGRQWKIEQLEREIRVLTIEIKEKTQRLEKVEDFANSTRRDAAAVASSGAGGRRYYSTWRYGGYGYRSSSGTAAKRAAKKLGKASAEAVEEYNTLSQELMEKRIQLSDAQVALERLKKQK